MLYILTGEDGFSIQQALDDIKKSVGGPDVLAVNTAVLDAQGLTLAALRPVCDAAPFLAEKRLVIIRGLLGRFEVKAARPGRKNGQPQRQDESRPFVEYFTKLPESTILVMVDEGRIKSQNSILKGLVGKAKVMTFPLLRDEKLRQWIERRVKGRGSSISPPAVELLCRFIGGNLWIMSGEIDKLVLFASARRIEEEDVRRIVSYAQEVTIFAVVDAILESRMAEAGRLLENSLTHGASPSYVLAMLARQLGLIVRVKEMRSRGMKQLEMQRALGLSSEFAVQRTVEQAGRHSLPRLKEAYHRLLDADLAIKTGKYEPELALNILVAELCSSKA